MDIERIDRIPYAEFARRYMLPGRPVVIRHAMPEWRAYDWTLDKLIEVLGDHPVRIGPDYIPFSKVAADIAASTTEQPGPYLRNLDIEKNLPQLWPDVNPRLIYAQPNWKASRLMPSGWIFPDNLVEIFIGGKGTSFPQLHQDWWGMHVFVTQLVGQKRAMLCPPEDRPYVYPTEENPLFSEITTFPPDNKEFPLFENAHPTYLTLEPGDTLFVPPGWWHSTYMPGVSITTITHNWNCTNWNGFVKDVWRRGIKKAPVKTAATVLYMSLVGAVLRVRDAIRGWPDEDKTVGRRNPNSPKTAA